MEDSEGVPSARVEVEEPVVLLRREAKNSNPDLLDSNMNYELKELPVWNPNLEQEFSAPSSAVRTDIPSALTDLPNMMPELYISDPGMRQLSGIERLPAGISSNARHYKMASDIFGTGMDRSWTAGDSPLKPAQLSVSTLDRAGAGIGNAPEFKQPEPHRGRNDPASFKITETASEISSEPTMDYGIGSPAARKARESSGNPLTGQGYNDDGEIKTAKRYYQGSNANQKLW